MTRETVKGRYLPEDQWREHKQREKKAGIAAARLSSAVAEINQQPTNSFPTPPITAANMFPVLDKLSSHQHPSSSTISSPPSPPILFEHSLPYTDSPTIRELKLKAINLRLAEGNIGALESSVQGQPLVFQFNNSATSYELDEEAPQNSTFIGYHDWLKASHTYVSEAEQAGPHDGARVCLLAKATLTAIQRKSLALSALQERECGRNQSVKHRGQHKNSIDTGVLRIS